MKKIVIFLLSLGILLVTSGCSPKTDDAKKFKEEYEKINNTTNSSNVSHRNLSIAIDNPFKYIEAEEIIKKIENKETFYLYFGSSYCPWCRSVIEEFIKTAQENNINEVYYIDIWKGDHEEILRDTYTLDENNKPKLLSEGSPYYQDLLKYLDNVLSDYTLTDKNNQKVKVGEKRIFAPNFIYIKEGKALKLTDGISDNQKNSRDELTDAIIQDEHEKFNEFFKES